MEKPQKEVLRKPGRPPLRTRTIANITAHENASKLSAGKWCVVAREDRESIVNSLNKKYPDRKYSHRANLELNDKKEEVVVYKVYRIK